MRSALWAWATSEKENRLIDGLGTVYQTAIMNFEPTRPVEEIIREYIDCFWNLYEPLPYLERTFRHFRKIKGWRPKISRKLTWHEISFLKGLFWRQGVIRETRFRFWWQMLAIAWQNPRLVYDYLVALGFGEHFFNFRHTVKAELETQLEFLESKKRENIELATTVVG